MPEIALQLLHGEITSFAERKTKDDVLYFTCPLCPNGHGIVVSWEPPSLFPSGAVWKKTGTSIADITIHPSINCDVPGKDGTPSSCKFHGWVQNGMVRW